PAITCPKLKESTTTEIAVSNPVIVIETEIKRLASKRSWLSIFDRRVALSKEALNAFVRSQKISKTNMAAIK
ncbi:hypothetical protein OFM15_29795, partial [Escherichia coli]|nr:hypothetical protein [Escherichia coli]